MNPFSISDNFRFCRVALMLALLLGPVVANAQTAADSGPGSTGKRSPAKPDVKVTKWLEILRKNFETDAILSTVQIKSAILKRRRFVEGSRFMLVCSGLTEQNRADAQSFATEIIEGDKEGSIWLADKVISVINEETAKALEGHDDDFREEERQQIEKLRLAVQDKIEFSEQPQGALVSGIRFVPGDDDSITLLLQGHVKQDSDRAQIEEIAQQAIMEDPTWKELKKTLNPSAEALSLHVARSGLALRYYRSAQDLFWKKKYGEVDIPLSAAISEDPGDPQFMWWKIVNAVANKQDDRAVLALHVALKTSPKGSSSLEIARQLERIQGPVRVKIRQLELQVLQGRR